MDETLIIYGLVLIGSVFLCWYFMNKKIKTTNEQLSDKQIVIKELAGYVDTIKNKEESVSISKPVKKVYKKIVAKTPAKKSKETPVKRGRKPKEN